MDRTPRVLSFAFALTLALTACDAADPGALADATQAPSGNTPHLTFASPDDFSRAYGDLVKMSLDVDASPPAAGFTSMFAAEIADAQAAEAGTKADAQPYQSVIEDPYLASLISPTGVVQIGSTVYKVGASTVFRGTTADLEAFNTQSEAELQSKSAAQSAPIERTATTAEAASRADLRCASFSGSGNSYKVCGTSFITNWPWIIHSAGGTTKVLKRGWLGIYWPVKGDVLRLTASHRIRAGAGTLPAATTVNATANRAWVLARIYKYAVGGDDFRGTISATHTTTHAGTTKSTTSSVTLP